MKGDIPERILMSNELYDIIVRRKSVRSFLDQPVEPEKRQKIFDAILAAPTTENMLMYSVISVDDMETRLKLSRQPAIKKAAMVLVFCADYRRWAKLFAGLTESNRGPGVGEYQLAIVDAVVAAENAVLAAEALGLSSVYLGDIMEHYEERAQALKLPAGVAPIVTLCIGYPTSEQLERAPVRRFPQEVLIHEEQYHDFSREELVKQVNQRTGQASLEVTEEWLQKYARRCMEGKSANERTKSIQEVLNTWETIHFDA